MEIRSGSSQIILIDLSQIMLANVMVSLKGNAAIDENVIRHMVLNSIRSYKKKFEKEYGEVVICADSGSFWRKDVFPYYKANRKKNRDESTIDWKTLFEVINKVRDEINEFLPYRLIRVDKAEADDVIAVLCIENSLEHINNNNKILIVSGDHDFRQLQKYPNVEQFDPIRKKKIVETKPLAYLREHIIKGDTGDGIPNFLSNDNCLVMSIRQNSVTAKALATYLSSEPSEFCTNETMLRNFKRNELIIDLSRTPDEIRVKILEMHEAQAGKNKSKILKYLMNYKLSNLLEDVGDF